jgi:hypothetical protein
MAENPIARIKELEAEKTRLVSAARKEAIDRAQAAVDDLNALGFPYQLVEGGSEPRKKAGGRGGARQTKDAPCPVCKFRTSPPHDARKHRGQGKRKRVFTSAELKEMGLEKA